MLLTLTARHFSEPCDKAYPVELRHPEVVNHLKASTHAQLWWQGRWCEHLADSSSDVQTLGGGRCFVGDAPIDHRQRIVLWISLPGNVDPRTVREGIVVEISASDAKTEALDTATDGDGPLLIVGPQRTGTTALQTALDAATRYKAPRDVNMNPWNTLEGFFTTQSVQRLARLSLTSPLGSLVSLRDFRTGVFDDSAMTDTILDAHAEFIDTVFRTVSAGWPGWIDKSPGWEPVIIAPIFKALFPTGKVVFMTREPVSCVLSIVRLEGRYHRTLEGAGLLNSIARNSAVWVVSHYLWRRFVAPLLPESARLVVSMESLRSRDDSTLHSIGEFLGLATSDRTDLTAALAEAPLGRHPLPVDEMDPAIPAIIERLCGAESRRWGGASASEIALPPSSLNESERIFRLRLEEMMVWLGVSREDAAPVLSDLWKTSAPKKPETQAAPGVVEPMVWDAWRQAGPLLTARLAMHRRQASATVAASTIPSQVRP